MSPLETCKNAISPVASDRIHSEEVTLEPPKTSSVCGGGDVGDCCSNAQGERQDKPQNNDNCVRSLFLLCGGCAFLPFVISAQI